MKLILPLLLIFSTISVQAEKLIPMKEVMNAYVWIADSSFVIPQVLNESPDQIEFKLLNETYSISRASPLFKIEKKGSKSEVGFFDSLTVEKLIYFSKSEIRSKGMLTPDQFSKSMIKTKIPTGFQVSQSIFQCSSDLPSRIIPPGSAVDRVLLHTWFQNGVSESFGMPNTDDSSYLGGVAHLRSPDSFLIRGPTHLKCAPILIPLGTDEKKQSEKVACVARKLSLSQNPVFTEMQNNTSWIANLDYHVLRHNCLMATRFVFACAGVQPSLVVNAGIGGTFKWSDTYSVSLITQSMKQKAFQLQQELQQIRSQHRLTDLSSQAESLTSLAFDLDSQWRGASGNPLPKTLREICDLALDQCN